MVQGRPRLISKVEPMVKAVINAYLPGNYGGEALASIIYGDHNPSGKLPYTYPRYPNSLEPYYHKHAEQLELLGSPTGTHFNPQYPFGFGLSYSSFTYSELTTDKVEYLASDTINVAVKITNTSNVAGKEVAQVFSSDHFASLTPSVKRLRAFSKINLGPGESNVVRFSIPVSQLAFVNEQIQWIVEEGDFTLSCGSENKIIRVKETRQINQ